MAIKKVKQLNSTFKTTLISMGVRHGEQEISKISDAFIINKLFYKLCSLLGFRSYYIKKIMGKDMFDQSTNIVVEIKDIYEKNAK